MEANHHSEKEFFREIARQGGSQSGELRFVRALDPDDSTMTYEKFLINEASTESRVAAQRHIAPDGEQKSQLI